MQSFDIVKKSNIEESFRVSAVMGQFDLNISKVEERFTGEIDIPDEWSVGLIVGRSGSGKTTIAKELFKDEYVESTEINTRVPIIDAMPENKTIEEITSTFNSVGFSSPPSWLKPFEVLSNGEKMRVSLAFCLLSDKEMVVFDEFTSVVDREVAMVGSLAMQKAIRRTRKKFIAVTCHRDVENWLMPDWVFDTDTMKFQKKTTKDQNSASRYTELRLQTGNCLGSITI